MDSLSNLGCIHSGSGSDSGHADIELSVLSWSTNWCKNPALLCCVPVKKVKKQGFTWHKRTIQISAVYVENPIVPQVMKILNRLYFDKIIFDPEVEVGCIPYLVRKSKVLDCDSTKTCYYFIKTVYGDRYIYTYIVQEITITIWQR